MSQDVVIGPYRVELQEDGTIVIHNYSAVMMDESMILRDVIRRLLEERWSSCS